MSKHKKFFILLITVSLFTSDFAAASSSVIVPGTKCLKVGLKQNSNSMVFTCLRIGKYLYWDNGVPIPTVGTPTPGTKCKTPDEIKKVGNATFTCLTLGKNHVWSDGVVPPVDPMCAKAKVGQLLLETYIPENQIPNQNAVVFRATFGSITSISDPNAVKFEWHWILRDGTNIVRGNHQDEIMDNAGNGCYWSIENLTVRTTTGWHGTLFGPGPAVTDDKLRYAIGMTFPDKSNIYDGGDQFQVIATYKGQTFTSDAIAIGP